MLDREQSLLLTIAMRGRGETYFHWVATAGLGLLLGGGAALFFSKAVAAIGNCVGDAVAYGGLGGFTGLVGAFYLVRARKGLPLARLASKRKGSVRAEGQLLTIASPGILREPITLRRAWITEITDKAPHDIAVTRTAFLQLSRYVPTTYLVLSGPLGLPTSGITNNPGALDGVAAPPPPTKHVDLIALDLEKPETANRQLHAWLATSYAMTQPPPSAPEVSRSRWPVGLIVAGLVISLCAFAVSRGLTC